MSKVTQNLTFKVPNRLIVINKLSATSYDKFHIKKRSTKYTDYLKINSLFTHNFLSSIKWKWWKV